MIVFSENSLTNSRRCLKFDAIPSIFPWSKAKECKSSTSQKALQPLDNDTCDEHLSVSIDSEEIVDGVNNGMECGNELEPSIADLQKEILELKIKPFEAQNKVERSLFRLENINHDNSLVKFYIYWIHRL